MKKLKLAIIHLIFFIVLSACSNQSTQPVIQKAGEAEDENLTEPVIVEEKVDEQEINEFIEFQVNNDVLRLNLKAVPILEQYLMAVKNPSQSVEEMQIYNFDINNQEILLLEFSCNENSCSYLLINQADDNQSYLVADLAKFENISLSPDQSRFLLKFSRTKTSSETSYFVHDIMVVDMDSWSILDVRSKTEAVVLNYTRPINAMEWLDNETISLTTPDMISSGENIDSNPIDVTPDNLTIEILYIEQN
ncbi:hypothetical protein [Oceanobacillus halophilus]|uniref:Lipoprotein n=1 Tax=Oceanobacillus halophilus TaxID=930130 RepID=A0A495ABP7_9BACI|nr:hypothetical protein [Oceanobacillus halophilus]RKQ37322.1 hypothetical protein D8M06_00525 [Oceanobacillus halophilus]